MHGAVSHFNENSCFVKHLLLKNNEIIIEINETSMSWMPSGPIVRIERERLVSQRNIQLLLKEIPLNQISFNLQQRLNSPEIRHYNYIVSIVCAFPLPCIIFEKLTNFECNGIQLIFQLLNCAFGTNLVFNYMPVSMSAHLSILFYKENPFNGHVLTTLCLQHPFWCDGIWLVCKHMHFKSEFKL